MNEPKNDSGVAIDSTTLLADEYRCAMCGGVFKKAWPDEEAEAEQEANGWGALAPEDRAVVCDDCYRQMTALYPPEEFNRDQANAEAHGRRSRTVQPLVGNSGGDE